MMIVAAVEAGSATDVRHMNTDWKGLVHPKHRLDHHLEGQQNYSQSKAEQQVMARLGLDIVGMTEGRHATLVRLPKNQEKENDP